MKALPPLKKPKKELKKNKFSSSWLEIGSFKNWLVKSTIEKMGNEYAHCKICDVDMIAHRNDIKRHSISNKHKENYLKIKTNKKITDVQMNPISQSTRRAELKLCGLLATNNLPFKLIDVLSPLCSDLFPDSKIARNLSLKRTKATAMVKQGLGDNFKEDLFAMLRVRGSFFSIIVDETTDRGTIKQCAFTVIYFCNKSQKVVTKFFDLLEMNSGKAEDLYRVLKTTITSKNIPFQNLIGFSADTCNVMFGEHNSVFALLKKDLPYVVSVKCSCHSIHLAASHACLKLPRSVEDLLRNLGSHFGRSFSRQQKFIEFQQFFQTDIHKILSPATTRWLSLKECVDRVLEQYIPLEAYLRVLCLEDPSKTNDDMLSTMGNKFTKVYMEFMSYTLTLLTDFNKLFQSEYPLLHKLKPSTETLLKNLCSSYLDIAYLKTENIYSLDHTNPRNFVPLDKVYLGVEATESLNTLKCEVNDQQSITQFLKTCLSFYIELVTQIKQRFNFKDELYILLEIVDPIKAQKYEIKSLIPILRKFPFLIDLIAGEQQLDNDWRQHAMLDFQELGLNKNDTAEKYWADVFLLKNAADMPIFTDLTVIIHFFLVLPFSNVSVERIFSNLNLIKTDHRNCLGTVNIASLIYSKQGIESCNGLLNFEPNQKMLSCNVWKK